MPLRVHPRDWRSTVIGTAGATKYARLSRNPIPGLHPVIVNHGWPQTYLPQEMIDQQRAGYLNALLGSGFTLYLPFTGSNWGHPTTTWPSVGGTAQAVFDAILTQAAADGLDASKVHLFSASMGACNAMNWSWRNPTKVASLYLLAPFNDFAATYDTSLANDPLPPSGTTIRTSMRTVYGAADRTALLAACEDNDPARNLTELAVIGPRIKALLLTGDEVIPFAGAEALFDGIGAELVVSPGSHFFPTGFGPVPEWDWSEYSVPAWFQEHAS
jgi:pimeloyl-ACP methyl ester carboxylesterase